MEAPMCAAVTGADCDRSIRPSHARFALTPPRSMAAGAGGDGGPGNRFITSSGEVGMDRTRSLLEPGSRTEHAPATNTMHRAATVIHEQAIFDFFITTFSLTGR